MKYSWWQYQSNLVNINVTKLNFINKICLKTIKIIFIIYIYIYCHPSMCKDIILRSLNVNIFPCEKSSGNGNKNNIIFLNLYQLNFSYLSCSLNS